MKKYFIGSIIYAAIALAMGVFFREFTKAYSYTGVTALSYNHVHLFVLGTLMFILLALLSRQIDINHSKLFKASFIVYNVGIGLTCLMFTIRGIMQVTKYKTNTTMIAGLAGIGHIVLAVGIILMIVSFITLATIKSKDKKQANTKK